MEGGSGGWTSRIAESVQVGTAQQRDRSEVTTRGRPLPLNTCGGGVKKEEEGRDERKRMATTQE